jgi:large subunit ribosomal protein L9
MKVILLQNIYKQGVAGEIVDVADGFARNFLIPRGMARQATKSAVKSHQNLMAKVEERRSEYEDMLNGLARKIDNVELFFERRASPTGTLYGSVTTLDIANALDAATGVDLNRRRISQQSIREIGQYDIPVRLGTETSPVLKIFVFREGGELQEFLAAREAAAKKAEVAAAEAEAPVEVAETTESAE